MAIRFVHITDAESDVRRVAEVQRIFRDYFGAVYTDFAERIPELLNRQAELGHRTILLAAEDARGRIHLPRPRGRADDLHTRVLGRNATYLLRGLQRGIYERRLMPRG